MYIVVHLLSLIIEWFILCQGKERILEIADRITALQKQMGMLLGGDYKEDFKFGLMEVVFEWARGMVSFGIVKT